MCWCYVEGTLCLWESFALSLKATLEWGDVATYLNLIPTSTSWDQPVRTPPPGGHAGLSCWGRRWIGDLLVKPMEVWATASQKCLSRWLRSAQHLLHHFYPWMECYWGLFFHGRSEGTQLLICDPSHGSEGEGLTSSGVKHYDRNGFSEVWFSTTRGMVEVLLQCRSWAVSLHWWGVYR